MALLAPRVDFDQQAQGLRNADHANAAGNHCDCNGVISQGNPNSFFDEQNEKPEQPNESRYDPMKAIA
jgi:hypothetical protein